MGQKRKFIKHPELTDEQKERMKIDKILDELDASRPYRLNNVKAKANRRYATKVRGY